jgi:methionyl-tRNA formyltransferase
VNIVFMGTPDFSVPTLDALIAAGHTVASVYTQPPRSAGRGQAERKTPVHQAADRHGLPVHTPLSFHDAETQAEFAACGADAAVVVAYGLILPQAVLDAPRLGCFNVHASLLPRWRGAAPIQRAIMAGDRETGVCIMRMEAGLDTGPVCLTARVPLPCGTTAGLLHDQLAALGGPLMCDALDAARRGELTCAPQPDEGITYAHKIDKSEARIDFDRPAEDVLNHIHGLSPFPGAWLELDGGAAPIRVKLLAAERADGSGAPGAVLDDDFAIGCSDGAIRPVRLQRAGKGAVDRSAFLRGFSVAAGTQLVQG